MNSIRTLTTKEKALQLNLDTSIYGSFAEIGAGQEIAANFFKAGGASGTVAKTMSAYDMSFSDAIYGKFKRYVCEPRLLTMLEREYKLLNLRLSKRKPTTTFFSVADTVETLNYERSNKGHGWLGVRFQLTPESEPNDCVLHVILNDIDAVEQQQAMGLLGVNLLYGCYFLNENPDELINSLLDNFIPGRIEVDVFRLTGPDFANVDNRLLSLKLVKNGLTNATMFGPDGGVLQPSEALYKKNVMILRGRFRPVTNVNMDMLNTGWKQFTEEEGVIPEETIALTELTLNALNAEGSIDEKDFLDRVDILCSLGLTVMISTFQEFYKLVNFLSSVTKLQRVGIILGSTTLNKLFDDGYYKELDGGILEAFGHLFAKNVKMYAYPAEGRKGGILTTENFKLSDQKKPLLDYLIANDKLADIDGADTDLIHIHSDQVLAMLKVAEHGWEDMVPEKVSDIIKENCLFDYPCSIEDLEMLAKKRAAREQAQQKLND